MTMVIPDPNYIHAESESKSDSNRKSLFVASAIDRFFSFIIDYLIFSPVVSFFLITTMKESVQIFRGQPLGQESTVIALVLAISYIFLFSGLQSFFIVYWGGTPGQIFLKLQVSFENDRHFLFLRAFIRQVGFWLSFLFLGLPWMKVILHRKHQTFYDRIADATVMTTKVGNTSLIKFDNEISYWRSLYATTIIFFFGLMIGFIWNQQRKVVNGYYAYRHLEDKNYLCPELESLKPSERLQVAVGLNLVNKLSDECLDREADFVLWHGKNAGLKSLDASISLAYLGKSLTTENNETEKEYLNLACSANQKQLSCKLSQAILNADVSELLSYLQTDKSFLATVLKYEFSVKHSRYQRELLADLTELSDSKQMSTEHVGNKQIKKYLLSERMNLNEVVPSRRPASRQDEDEIFKTDNKIEIEKLLESL